MVIGHNKTVVMIPEMREGEDIQDVVGKGWDDRWFGQVFDGSLCKLDRTNAQCAK